MPITSELEVPVLVIGAGPAGLTAAVTLARYGITVHLVERRDEPSRHPKATVISTRSMELIRSWGLEDIVLSGGVDVEMLAWSTRTLTDATGGVALDVGYPTREQAAAISPTAPACVPQDHLESVLHEYVNTLPTVHVRRGVEAVDINADVDPVQVLLADRTTSEQTLVRARFVIGADGASSLTRRSAGIAMTEPAGILTATHVVFRAPLWDVLGDRRYGVYFTSHPQGAGGFFPVGGDRWVYGLTTDPDSGAADALTDEVMVERIRYGSGVADLPVRAEPVTGFTSAAQLADAFSRGSVFLAGDSAHRVTPRGGTGMNTAIHGAFDLSWKLAWVLLGWADYRLLDTYETQRRPVAAHNVARSADPNGSARDHEQELAVDLGGRIPHAWTGTSGARTSTLDLVGDGLTLLAASPSSGWAVAAASLESAALPVTAHSVDDAAALILEIAGDGAVLVRPDGRPIARWPTSERADTDLRSAVGEMTSVRL